MKTKEANPKKALLIELSNTVAPLVEIGQYSTINEALINEVYTTEEKTTFNTYKGWAEKGYQVKKGEKSVFVWSKPLKGKAKTEAEATDEGTPEEKKYKFFGLAYLFDNTQVEPKK